MPSPVPDRPGLLLRDPYRYAEETLIIPPLLVRGLALFDGEQTDLDLQVHLSHLVGEIIPTEIVEGLIHALKNHGFLETSEFDARRAGRHADFARASSRLAAYAGSAYPKQEAELRRQLDSFLAPVRAAVPSRDDHSVIPPGGPKGVTNSESLIAVAAPHVSPVGGWQSYAAAYNRLPATLAENAEETTIVLLCTSHYGQPERFGLTRKPFDTPFGRLQVDTARVDWLESQASQAIVMEDYCHAIEHSVEFQCIFLQHALGSGFRILPILCGPFVEATLTGAPPERDEGVNRFFDALGKLSRLNGDRLFWVLGVDMAHVGRRYGGPTIARANEGEMVEVAGQDKTRLDRVCAGDAEGFLSLVADDGDPLNWCGFSPIYTFLRAVNGAQGSVVRYDQWNIDEESVVSFAALEFRAG